MFDMLNFLKRLVSLDTNSTTKSNYREAAQLIKSEAERIGADVEIVEAEAPDGKPRPNVFVRVGRGGKKILIVTHFDVVPGNPPWKVTEPFKPKLVNGKLYGRGAADNKGAIAATLAAFADILSEGEPKNSLVMIAACDEEVGGEYGLRWIHENHPELLAGDLAWIVDASCEYIALGASGVIWARLVIKGKGGHPGIPKLADNPIYKLPRVITGLVEYARWLEKNEQSKLKAFRFYEGGIPGRLSVTIVRAGTKENVIPGTLELVIDRRVPPGLDVEKARKDLERKIAEICSGIEYEFSVIRTVRSYITDPENPLVKRFVELSKRVYGELMLSGEYGGNDGVYFSPRMPVVCLGCIRTENNIHEKDEFVYVSDLERLREMVKLVASEL